MRIHWDILSSNILEGTKWRCMYLEGHVQELMRMDDISEVEKSEVRADCWRAPVAFSREE